MPAEPPLGAAAKRAAEGAVMTDDERRRLVSTEQSVSDQLGRLAADMAHMGDEQARVLRWPTLISPLAIAVAVCFCFQSALKVAPAARKDVEARNVCTKRIRHLLRAFQGNVAGAGAEGVRRQAFHRTTAFSAANRRD